MDTQIKPVLTAKRPTVEADPSGAFFNRFKNFTKNNPRDRNFVELLRSVRDYNPDVSKAVDNIITLSNPGYTLKVYKIGKTEKDSPTPDKEGQRIVEQFAARCFHEYSGAYDFVAGSINKNLPGLNALINMIHLVSYTQGAFAAEVKLTKDLNDIEDVYPVDPIYIEFQQNDNFEWIPGVTTKGKFQPLNQTLFRYIAKDPDVDKPEGRSPIMSALDTVYFQQEVMRDLKAIAHQSNMPRIDIKVVQEIVNNVLKETRPDLMGEGKVKERQEFMDAYLSDIQDALNTMKADDAFIHWDAVEVDYVSPKSTAIELKDLMSAIDKSIVSATKQLPVLLGRNEGATTTHATVQWQVYILQVVAFQRISHAIVTWLLNLLLRVHGRNSYVVFEYEKHKTTDDYIDSQALNMNAITYKFMVDQGWITNDEAALFMAGHKAVGEPIMAQVQNNGNPAQPQGQNFPAGGAPPRTKDMSAQTAST